MSESIAIIEDIAGVIEIHIDRPDKKNALTAPMYHAMTAALADASARADIAVVLFTANGDAFCAGNDLKDFMAGPEGGAAAFAFIRAIAAFDKPIVAAVQGLAVGVGTTMLLHCDLIYAAPDARFIMPFVNLGLVPEAGSSLLAPAPLGHAKAAAMLMLGEPMDAEAADRAGLVTAVVPADGLLAHARAQARILVAKPPGSRKKRGCSAIRCDPPKRRKPLPPSSKSARRCFGGARSRRGRAFRTAFRSRSWRRRSAGRPPAPKAACDRPRSAR